MRERLHLDPDLPERIFSQHGYIKTLQGLVPLSLRREIPNSLSGMVVS
jgi:hypothetical protein